MRVRRIQSKRRSDDLFEKIKAMLPAEAGFVKAEFEGPDIVVYLKNTKAALRERDDNKEHSLGHKEEAGDKERAARC